MTLIGTDELPLRSVFRFGWVIRMRTEDTRDVRVVVADEALLGFDPPPLYVDKIPQLEGEHRSRIEKIASVKHVGGLVEQDGSVLITQDDIY
jgi:hypothetical protein